MTNKQIKDLAAQAGRLARKSASALEAALDAAEPDVKKIRDYAAVLKDLSALALSLRTEESRDVAVAFLGEAAAAAD